MSKKWLKPKDCPLCDKRIYELNDRERPIRLNQSGVLFWVKFNDGTKAQFAICRDCLLKLTDENVKYIMDCQIFTWGMEIIHSPLSIAETYKQWMWFVNTAIFLSVVKWSHLEDGI